MVNSRIDRGKGGSMAPARPGSLRIRYEKRYCFIALRGHIRTRRGADGARAGAGAWLAQRSVWLIEITLQRFAVGSV